MRPDGACDAVEVGTSFAVVLCGGAVGSQSRPFLQRFRIAKASLGRAISAPEYAIRINPLR
jgi:hypothetical protein